MPTLAPTVTAAVRMAIMVAESRLPKQRASGVCSTLQNSQQTPMRQQTRYIMPTLGFMKPRIMQMTA